jgi:RNA polymerase sigma-70 factor (ECF subfamily)
MNAAQLREVAPSAGSDAADDFAIELVGLRRTLYQRALFLTQDRNAAEDLAQATVERALVSRSRFQSGTNLRAWLLLMMRNLFIDGRRRAVFQVTANVVDEESAAPAPDAELSPVDLLSSDDVAAAAALLGHEQREIFTLAYIERLSYREIAGRLGISPNATGGRLFRVRTRMRRLLEIIFERRLDDFARGRRCCNREMSCAR